METNTKRSAARMAPWPPFWRHEPCLLYSCKSSAQFSWTLFKLPYDDLPDSPRHSCAWKTFGEPHWPIEFLVETSTIFHYPLSHALDIVISSRFSPFKSSIWDQLTSWNDLGWTHSLIQWVFGKDLWKPEAVPHRVMAKLPISSHDHPNLFWYHLVI